MSPDLVRALFFVNNERLNNFTWVVNFFTFEIHKPQLNNPMGIIIEKLTEEEILAKGVYDWPIWEKEISEFDWTYDEKELFFVLEGEVFISVDNQELHVMPGDFVSCDKNVSCRWRIVKGIKKHYNFI